MGVWKRVGSGDGLVLFLYMDGGWASTWLVVAAQHCQEAAKLNVLGVRVGLVRQDADFDC